MSICECGHHTDDHSYEPKEKNNRLDCDKCDCKDFKLKDEK